MKRIQSACICQTLHFQLKEDLDHNSAIEKVRIEVEHYKQQLQRGCILYRILEERTLEDGSVLIRIVKQYSNSPVGDYLK